MMTDFLCDFCSSLTEASSVCKCSH